jgi:hypothetical protein
MRNVLGLLGRGLQALLFAAAMTSAVHAEPCDNDETADRAMAQAQRQAERAQRIAEQIARQAQQQAEMAALRAEWAAQHASEAAQREAERVQAIAEQVAERAQRDARRAARAAERAAGRAAIGSPGVVVTDDAVLFVDGPEVPRDAMMWADDVRSRRMRQPVTTDTTLRVAPGITLSLTNLSGDITVQVWDRNEVRVNAEHDRRDRITTAIKDGMLRLGVDSPEGGPADVEWNLTVPAYLPLEIQGLESEIAVTGLRASVIAKSLRGDVRVNACQGPMELISTEGDVHAEDVNGDVTASSLNRSVRLVRVRGPIQAQSVNGDIQMDDVSSRKVNASTLNGKVYYASKFQPHGRYELSSHNGNVYVGVDRTESMNVTVSSFNGMFESSIPLPPTPPEAPTPPAPPTPQSAKAWKTWKMTWPVVEAAPASSSASGARSGAPQSPRMRFKPTPSSAPYPSEVELESFGGLIQFSSRAEIERVLLLQRAMRDSVDAVRRLQRLRNMRLHERAHPAPTPKPGEDDDKD